MGWLARHGNIKEMEYLSAGYDKTLRFWSLTSACDVLKDITESTCDAYTCRAAVGSELN